MNFRAIPALDAYDMLQPKNSDQWILGWKCHWTDTEFVTEQI